MATKNDNGVGLVGGVLLVLFLVLMILLTSKSRDIPKGPRPYQAGEPGFQALDHYNYDSDGSRVTNGDKAIMRDAINKFEEAQHRRNSGN
jgi:hypothetical protein